MRKILLGLVIAGFVLVLFVSFKPRTADLTVMPEAPGTDISGQPVTLDALPYVSVIQGGSELALYLSNNTQQPISLSLGHDHPYLTFQPQGDRLDPGITREIFVHVKPQCPVGEISLPVYLRAEIDGKRIGMETTLHIGVIPGELALEFHENSLSVLLNGEQAPRGIPVYYRVPGAKDWMFWSETPRTTPPSYILPGAYRFEFMAELGGVESAVETFKITVEAPQVKKDPEAEAVVKKAAPAVKAPAKAKPQPPRERSGMEHTIIKNEAGDKYVGEFKDGVKHGQGTLTYANGDKYVGEFKNDMRHGQGTYTFADGRAISGRWENDNYLGP